MCMIFEKYDNETTMVMYGLAANILELIEDRKHRWTYDLSRHMGGKRSPELKIMTNRKRDMTRTLFYSKVGAGSPLDGVFMKNFNFYTASTIGVESGKLTGDHINPSQDWAEFFYDKLFGFHTEKDTSILDLEVIVNCLKYLMKKVKITKTLNNALSKYTPSSGNDPIVISQKYPYLNENIDQFKGELTLYRDGRLATDEELTFLFGGCPIDGYEEWQIEKYGAKSFGYNFSDNKYNSIMSLKDNSVGNLENFFE